MNYKILIVDDEPANIETIIGGLLDTNYNVLIATNGTAGCEIAIKHFPNLIIMDWDMPDMNGIEAIKILKQNETTANIPVIMATGVMLTSENLKTALEAGAIDYIRKPIDEIELLARINSALMLFDEMEKNIALQTRLIRKEKEQAEKEIADSKQALARLTLRIVQNNELNEQLIGELIEMGQKACKEGRQRINRIISKFKAGTKNINWKEFDILFDQVHSHFFENLNKQFPHLTSSERKLCVLFHLNLSSKEVASFTLQSENTLKKARHRLRKKLNIDSKQSIHQFLQQFL